MDNILLFQHVDSYGARLRQEGITDFAHEVGWNVQCYEEHVDAATLAEIRGLWNPVGTILGPSTGVIEYDVNLFPPASTILLDCFEPKGLEHFTSVLTDSVKTTELAARELLSVPSASYGFIPWPNPRVWSENRKQSFAKILAREGRTLSVFAPSRHGLSPRAFELELVPWLVALPKPCGLYAANDRVATHVLSACRLAHIDVPFTCTLVSVDNNEKVCSGENPTISSVTLDFYGSGYRAAQLLHEMATGKRTERPIESLPPLGFVRRNSSRVFLQTDHHVLHASDLIRARACEGLTAAEVVKSMPGARRSAEMRFRKATGHSILDEIHAVRMEKAKELLRNPRQRLDAVAEQCGYASDTTFRRLFKQATGMTLREYQKNSFATASMPCFQGTR